jgi:hypothetical protein
MVGWQGEHSWENERWLIGVGADYMADGGASGRELELHGSTVGGPKMGEGWVALCEIRRDGAGTGEG